MIPAALRRRAGQLVRYGAVSVIATGTSLVTLTALVGTRLLAPAAANIVATCVGMVPSFELNRRWVWRRTGRPSLTRQILPSVVLSLAGLFLSTAAVQLRITDYLLRMADVRPSAVHVVVEEVARG